MPDINFGEWIIIALVALIVVGPRKLPELAHKIGGWVREARAMATDFRVGLEREIADLDAVRDDIKSISEEVSRPIKEVAAELEAAADDLKPLDWTGPVTDQGPTPADAERDFNRIHNRPDDADENDPAPATDASAESVDPVPDGLADS